MESETRTSTQSAEQEYSTPKQASSEASELEGRLASETHLRRFTESVMDSRQREIEDREMEKDQLAAKVEALKKTLASTQRQLAEAQNQTEIKSKQLYDAKEQIFRLQPRRKDITEAEAKEAYQNLVGNVQRWVENRAQDVIEDMENGRLKAKAVSSESSRLVTLLREQSRRWLAADQSDEYHIVGVIMNYLHLALFSKSFYCPLDDTEENGTLTWIDQLENTMSRLPRGLPRPMSYQIQQTANLLEDVAHCREWRSETLTALTHQSAFRARRQRHLSLVVDDLTSLLSTIAPRTPPAELHGSIRRSIVEPAADLVHQLQLASSIFSLKWPARTAATRLEVYQCLNLANGGAVLDLVGTKQTSPARRNVSYLFDVAPGLFVERIEGGRKLALKAVAKPTVLVYNVEGDVPQGPTVMRWLWDNAPAAQGSGRSVSRAPGSRSKHTYPRRISKL
ncbi:hypothetical protein F66182_11064 [Fusarium sp. NRRL 66182]|nr:hypothetical protein F66182_11064 [Fusarium sp. NRRL 66182]